MLRAMLPRTRLEWLEKLAAGAMWLAIGASSYLANTGSGWTWVTSACVLGLALVSAASGVGRRRAGRRLLVRKGGASDRDGGLGGHGLGVEGAAGDSARVPRTLALVARLMPPSAGRRWLAEAESLLAEADPADRVAATRSYLRSAPRLAAMLWAREVLRRTRTGPRRPG